MTALLIQAWPLPVAGAVRFNQDLWYLGLFKVGALLVLPVVVLRSRSYRLADLLPDWRLGPASVAAMAVAFAFGMSLNLQHLGGLERALAPLPAGRTAAIVALGVVAPLLSAGIPEEVVFRGLLHTRLEATAGRWVAWLGTALLFTAWHIPSRYILSTGVEGAAGDLPSVLLGTGLPVLLVALVLGWMWDRRRSLPTLIALHWAIDILPATSSFAGVRF